MVHDTRRTLPILQVGRSHFISSVLSGISDSVTVVSSNSAPSASLKDMREGMIVFVPPRIPDQAGYERFETWFARARVDSPRSVHISLISSLICGSDRSLDERYEEYRTAKTQIERVFSYEFEDNSLGHTFNIIRLGMFMPRALPLRAQAIRLLAHTLRPFVPPSRVYVYTNKAVLISTLSVVLSGSCEKVVESSIEIKGTGLLPTPKLLSRFVSKLYSGA